MRIEITDMKISDIVRELNKINFECCHWAYNQWLIVNLLYGLMMTYDEGIKIIKFCRAKGYDKFQFNNHSNGWPVAPKG